MMEIEFRAQVKWNGNHYFSGEWVYGDLVRHADGKTYIYDREDIVLRMPNGKSGFPGPRYEYVEIKPETVGMYTGLKDMNGNKIYVGDIAKDNKGNYGKVYYDHKMACFNIEGFFVSSYDYPTLAFRQGTDDIEVIGNVHEGLTT